MVNRSTEYDWMRYLWEMVTVQGLAIDDIWDIWVEADPATWSANDGGSAGDFPIERWEDAADLLGFSTEHDNAEDHGLTH